MHQTHQYLHILQNLNPSKVSGKRTNWHMHASYLKSHITCMCSDIIASNKDITSSSLKMMLKCYDAPQMWCIWGCVSACFTKKLLKLCKITYFDPPDLPVDHTMPHFMFVSVLDVCSISPLSSQWHSCLCRQQLVEAHITLNAWWVVNQMHLYYFFLNFMNLFKLKVLLLWVANKNKIIKI